MNVKNLVTFTQTIVSKFEQLDDIVDDALSSYKDYVDTAGDLAGPV